MIDIVELTKVSDWQYKFNLQYVNLKVVTLILRIFSSQILKVATNEITTLH